MGAWHSAERFSWFVADENGITFKGKNLYGSTGYLKTWADLGITDINNAGGHTVQYSDNVSGISFSAQIADDATKEDVINAFNKMKFDWDYIDCMETQNAVKGITVGSGDITNNFTAPKVNSITYFHHTANSDLYAELGYTTPSSIVNGITVDVSLGVNAADNVELILSSNGHSVSTVMNSSNSSGTYAQMGGFSNDPTKVLLYVGKTGTADVKNAALKEFIAQNGSATIATLHLPGPYKYSLSLPEVTKTEYSIENVKTGTLPTQPVTPDPPQPVTPNPPVAPTQGTRSFWIQSGSEAGEGMYLEIDPMDTTILGINDMDVSTIVGANHAMDAVQGALKKVSANRSRIGAQQNRLEYTIMNGQNEVENTMSAESRIRDTDMAKEMTAFSKEMILENIGQAMLAQANKSNQDVLSLLS